MEKWKALCAEIIGKIKGIDDETPWQETEPEWWINMMSVEREIYKWYKWEGAK